MQEPEEGLRIDLGCGHVKKEGTIGIDIRPAPGVVDHVLDIETQPLPFADRSVAYVHSSHFLEHARDIGRIFGEISRVCVDGARLELWTPYAWSNEGLALDHKSFFTEELYLHICLWYPEAWRGILGARWVLNELHYVVHPETLRYLQLKYISLDFALRHMHNIASEMCAHITVLHREPDALPPPLRRTFSIGRFEPRYKVKPDTLARRLESGGVEAFTERACESIQAAVRNFADGEALPPM